MAHDQEPAPSVLAQNLLQSLLREVDTYGLDALLRLDDIVAHSLSVVRCSINDHRPIHRLPAEVLAIVFRYALPSYNGGIPQSGTKEPDVDAERRVRRTISAVCTRWRAVALNLNTFWQVVDTSSAPWANECLSRSGNMPLHVYARYPLDALTEVPLSAQGARINDLFLEFPKKHQAVVPMELPAFLPDVPNLECLSIVTRSKPFEDGRPTIDLFHCPPLFPQPPPSLRMLILKNQCWFPSVPYENLTHLHIAHSTPLDLRALVNLLQRCTALEQLILVDVYFSHAQGLPAGLTASLPHLRLLTLGITQAHLSMRRILPYLVLPPGVVMRIAGREATRALADLRPLPPFPFTAEYDTLVLDTRKDGFTIQSATTHASQDRGSGVGGGLLLDLERGYIPLGNALKTHILPGFIPLERITRLVVRSDKCDLTMNYIPAISASVTTVVLIDAHPVSATSRNSDGDAGNAIWHAMEECAACFPKLEALEIWSPRRTLNCLPKVPSVAFKLRRFAFCHIRSPDDGQDALGPPPGKEFLEEFIPEVDFRVVGAAEADALVHLPGVRPQGHVFDWE
ncbi:hypothetical protein C8Q77DRAFT_497759 [Trametes polyzona]|nr:hypothetical protein C8Q77DRAFT_497759 [Trametes polyzona]